MENKILVIYVGVAEFTNLSELEKQEILNSFVQKVAKKITPNTFEGEIIVIPTHSYDTRIECINPKYITDAELIKENTKLMKELRENLQYQLDQLKEEKNEK